MLSPISIIGIFTCVLVILYTYIRLSYGFWYYQPVFHLYDLHSYIFPCGIVQYNLPEKDKFTNTDDIVMYTIDDKIYSPIFQQIVHFINNHYMAKSSLNYILKTDEVFPYFSHHKHPSFLSLYKKNKLLVYNSNDNLIPYTEKIGVMTTRPVQVWIRNMSPKQKLYAYYVDYLCVHKDHRKKGIAPEVIQTHYYMQRRNNKSILANLFKREGELTGIVPLCVFKSYMFPIKNIRINTILSPNLQYVACNKSNIHVINDFMIDNGELFNINICVDLGNLLHLIEKELYYLYFMMDTLNHENILACYILKSINTSVENNKVISCVGSICVSSLPHNEFVSGFQHIIIGLNSKYDYVDIESLSHNQIIIDELTDDINPVSTCPMAYFFHNYVYNTLLSKKVLIIGT